MKRFIKHLVLVVTALAVVLVPGAALADDGDGCAFTPPHTVPAIDDKYSWNCPLDGP
ncbi:MAG TPA: hypothetical protein VE174_12430 [Actinomycetota bacterium]|nr:hypothetical protein [Actinomycetota bacterium]